MSSKGYYVYLDKCLLPVAPSRIVLENEGGSKSVTLIDSAEVSILKNPKLTAIKLNFLIPQKKYPFLIDGKANKDARYYTDYLKYLKGLKRPFQFIVSRMGADSGYLFSTNIKVSLEDYTLTEDAAKGIDIEAAVKLKQYKDYGVKRVKLSLGGAHLQSGRPASSTSEKSIMIGSDVIVNGRLYGTSYGDAPGQTRTNYRGKVNFINLKGSHPYHITTPSGLWQGWVTKDSLKAVT